ncbi:MAG TPA: hypothetical protein VIW69_16895, partial [Candidatus Elarobacter sp.]
DLLTNAGIDRIAAHVLALTDHLTEGLRSRGYTVASDRARDDVKSGIVLFRRDDADPVALGKRLNEAKICTTYRANGIRVAPHGHNTRDDIDAILAALP